MEVSVLLYVGSLRAPGVPLGRPGRLIAAGRPARGFLLQCCQTAAAALWTNKNNKGHQHVSYDSRARGNRSYNQGGVGCGPCWVGVPEVRLHAA